MVLNFGEGAVTTAANIRKQTARKCAFRFYVALVNSTRPNSWLATAFPYWEGPVTVAGSHQGAGYLELTGY